MLKFGLIAGYVAPQLMNRISVVETTNTNVIQAAQKLATISVNKQQVTHFTSRDELFVRLSG